MSEPEIAAPTTATPIAAANASDVSPLGDVGDVSDEEAEVDASERGARDVTTLKTLTRGITVLEAIADLDGSATAKHLSRRLDLKIGTCYHLLRTLKEGGYVVRSPGGEYDLGPRAAALGRGLIARTRPQPQLSVILTRLHAKTQETSYISGWHRGRLTLQDYFESEQSLRVGGLQAGFSGDLHCRASGKAVLAFLPAEQVETMFHGVPMPARTPQSITDYEQLVVALSKARRARYAEDLEEFAEGVCCVSAAFFGADGAPAGSFSVSAPTSRYQRSHRQLAAAVLEAAAMATNVLTTGRLSAAEGPSGSATSRGTGPHATPTGAGDGGRSAPHLGSHTGPHSVGSGPVTRRGRATVPSRGVSPARGTS